MFLCISFADILVCNLRVNRMASVLVRWLHAIEGLSPRWLYWFCSCPLNSYCSTAYVKRLLVNEWEKPLWCSLMMMMSLGSKILHLRSGWKPLVLGVEGTFSKLLWWPFIHLQRPDNTPPRLTTSKSPCLKNIHLKGTRSFVKWWNFGTKREWLSAKQIRSFI